MNPPEPGKSNAEEGVGEGGVLFQVPAIHYLLSTEMSQSRHRNNDVISNFDSLHYDEEEDGRKNRF